MFKKSHYIFSILNSPRRKLLFGIIVSGLIACLFIKFISFTFNSRTCSLIDMFRDYYAFYQDQYLKPLDYSLVTIPFHYDNSGLILLPIQLNGRKTDFLLDTGCSQTIIWENTANSITKVECLPMYVDGVWSNADICNIEKMVIGGSTLSNICLFVQPFSDAPDKTAGLLGGNILKRFTLTIDYKAKQLSLIDPRKALSFSSNAVVVPFKDYNNIPLIGIILDRTEKLSAVVDTGATFNTVFESVVAKLLRGPISACDSVSGLQLRTGDIGFECFKNLQVGSLKFPKPIFAVMLRKKNVSMGDLSDAAILGNNFLSHFRVTIDYQHKVVVFDPINHMVSTAADLLAYGDYLGSHRHAQDALAVYDRALALEPELAIKGYLGRADIKTQLKQYKGAVADFTKAIVLDPYCSDTFKGRGYAYQQLGNDADAIRDFDKALSLDLENTSVYDLRAQSYRKLGKESLALQDRQKARELTSGYKK